MSEQPTATIDGVEFNADDLEAAIEEIADEYDDIDLREGGIGVHKSVAIKGDRYADGDFHLANVSNLTSLSEDGMAVEDDDGIVWTSVRQAREAIEECRDDFDAVEYVADIVAPANTVVASDDEDAFNEYGDVSVQYGHLSSNEMQDLAADDAITMHQVRARDGSVEVSVLVDEDIATE